MQRSTIRVAFLSLSTLLPLVGGCSSSGTSGPGAVSIALTDMASEELETFELEVRDLVFTKLGGSTVSVLPRATRVDFAALESLSELVVTSALEAGSYTSMAMTLDFTNAVVAIAGNTAPATVVDAQGNPITGAVTVQVDFALGARPVFTGTRHHLYVLDLDLDQGVTVDSVNNVVTFVPVLSAAVDPASPKPVSTTGILESVSVATRTFGVERRAVDGSTIGVFTVRTNALTVFQIDGVVSLGNPGLSALGALTPGTDRVWVQGTIDPAQQVLNAVAVEAGAGVFANGQGWVLGHVVARDNGAGSDATLTVLGHSRAAGGARLFNAQHAVNVSLAQTKVLRRGAGNSLDTDALNVGQLVLAFGDLTGTVLDATGPDGVVRMLRTSIFGVATGAPSGNLLTLDVTRFDRRPEVNFNFVVGGQGEADRDLYTVDVTGLDTGNITAGTKVRAFAWINPVGIPGDANARANALVRGTEARVLFLQWSPPSSSALALTTPTSISFDTTGTVISLVGDGFAPIAVNPTPPPTIEPLTLLGVYRVVQNGTVEVFLGFDAFRQSVAVHAALGNIFRVAAFGTYDQGTQVFRALAATVVVE